MLPTPRDGIQEDHTEPFIYKNKLQSITQETRDKLQILTEITNSIVSFEKEESEIKNELNNINLKGDKEHGPLAERLVTLEDQYKFLTNLEQELMDIRKKGNIIAYEKGGKAENNTGNSLDTRKSQRKELGSHTDGPSTIHMVTQSMQYNKIITKQCTRSNSNPDHVHTTS